MRQFHDYLNWILDAGIEKGDRTGTGTISAFGGRMEYHMADGFPLLTTKRTHWPSIIAELCWFLAGGTNIDQLHRDNCTIWDEWADEAGDLGPVYGAQWRAWRSVSADVAEVGRSKSISVEETYTDQITEVEKTLMTNPDDRRMIVSAWNVGEVPRMALPPCHLLFQLWTRPLLPDEPGGNEYQRELSLQVYQRSCDSFLGVPFNIASYAALLHIFSTRAGMRPGKLVWIGGDCHIYSNHREQVSTLLAREPRDLPQLIVHERVWSARIGELRPEWFELVGYDPHPGIKAEVSV